MKKFDIVILAGQSNAEGGGIGTVDHEFEPSPLIWSLDAEKTVEHLPNRLNITYYDRPFVLEMAMERTYNGEKVGDLALRFLERYSRERLAPDRKVLLLRCAIGGSGFIRHEWTTDGPIYRKMLEMVDYALSLNPENRLVAMLWHQGECDSWEETPPDIFYLELYPDELTLQQGQEMLSHVVKTISTWGITVVSAEKLGTWREHFQVTQAELDYSSFTNWDNGRLCIFLPFSGTVAGQSFSGVKITSTAYQPHFGLTERAVENAKRYAVAHGFDTIAIHAYARLTNNSLVLNGQEWIGSSWKEILIPTEQLSTAYDFWSQSEGTTEIYLWFEFRHTSEVPTLPSTPQPEPTEPEPTHPQLKPTNPLPDEPDSVIPQPTIPKPTEPMPTSPTNPEAPAVNGDVNGDGKVNNKDYYYLYLYLKEEGNALKDELADINLDGQVNEIDLKCLHAFLTGHTVWIGGRYG